MLTEVRWLPRYFSVVRDRKMLTLAHFNQRLAVFLEDRRGRKVPLTFLREACPWKGAAHQGIRLLGQCLKEDPIKGTPPPTTPCWKTRFLTQSLTNTLQAESWNPFHHINGKYGREQMGVHGSWLKRKHGQDGSHTGGCGRLRWSPM